MAKKLSIISIEGIDYLVEGEQGKFLGAVKDGKGLDLFDDGPTFAHPVFRKDLAELNRRVYELKQSLDDLDDLPEDLDETVIIMKQGGVECYFVNGIQISGRIEGKLGPLYEEGPTVYHWVFLKPEKPMIIEIYR